MYAYMPSLDLFIVEEAVLSENKTIHYLLKSKTTKILYFLKPFY